MALKGNKKDLTGQRFGRLVAVEECGRSKSGYVLWKCRCDCGADHLVKSSHLLRGNSRSCGCLQAEQNTARFTQDLTGQRFGRWLVLNKASRPGYNKAVWHCRCDCGTEKDVPARYLKYKPSSCGCRAREVAADNIRKGNANRVYEKGSEHRWWNDTLTEKDRKYQRPSNEVRIWREAVWTRDNYTCDICSTRGGRLAAHHLVPWRSSVELRFDVSNGITLCYRCHRQYHNRHHSKTATPETYQEFKSSRQKVKELTNE